MSTVSPLPRSQPSRRDLRRRDLLRRGASVGAVGLGLAGTAPAAAATSYQPAHYRGAPLLPKADRHLVTRFSYGLTPTLTAQVRSVGGARAWFEKQLDPRAVSDTDTERLADWWPSLALGPTELWTNQRDGIEGGWEVMSSYQRWLLMRRVSTNRQLSEVMTEFWMNHLNVSVRHDATFTHRVDYDRIVRANALGTFEELLHRAITHPAMSIYLDNAYSTKDEPNENLGRELLELHTVGRGNYDEDDVKASARILTGYLVDMWETFTAYYSPRDHWTGPVTVMGFHSDNDAADGRAVVRNYLSYLARHPRTADRIAGKLCTAFVSDTPSAGLVARLAAVYLDNDTAIVPVLRALISSREFKESAGQKVRDPSADVVATYRALRVKVAHPPDTDNGWAATAILWQAEAVGQPPCAWPRPDGQPIDNRSWSSPARLLASMDVHWSMSGGWWPTEGITYVSPQQWLPRSRIRFDVLVDHLSQQLLGRRSTGALLRACVLVCPDDWDISAATIITRDHDVTKWGFHRLLSTILDSPSHLTR